MAKTKSSFFYKEELSGSPEELKASWEAADKYLFKILSYADKDQIEKKDIKEARRIFAFAKQGPRANHFILSKNSKLVSADVLLILSSGMSHQYLADRYGVSVALIQNIRKGRAAEWEWEYRFVSLLRNAIVNQYKTFTPYTHPEFDAPVIYTLYRNAEGTDANFKRPDKVMGHFSSKRTAEEYRKSCFQYKMYRYYVRTKKIDKYYPIIRTPLIR